jgi:hypothetical protein
MHHDKFALLSLVEVEMRFYELQIIEGIRYRAF